MPSLQKSRNALLILGLVGLAAVASTTEASAGRGGGGGGFRGGGGGGFRGSFGGGMRSHAAMPRMNVGGGRRMSLNSGMRIAPGPHFATNNAKPTRPPIGPHFGNPNQGRPLGQIGGNFPRPFPQLGNRPFNQANNGQVLSPNCQFAKCHIMVPAKTNPGTVMCIRAPCNVNVPKPTNPGQVMCFRAPCNVPGHNPNDPLLHPAKNPCAFGRCQGPFGPGPNFPRPYPLQPAYQPQPSYPVQQAYPQQAYQPAYQAPAAYAPSPAAYQAPAPAPAPAAVQQPTSVSVIFQPTATSNDIVAFIKAYNVTVSSGPDASGIYRLQVSTGPVAQDQLNQIVQSMQSQTNIVSQVGA